MIFHWRHSGSGIIRGEQTQRWLGSQSDDDRHIWVKMQPPDDFPPRSYLDVLDAHERIPWLLEHPAIGVIASSLTGQEYLQRVLKRTDIHYIPQHHCNYGRARRASRNIKVAGVVGGKGALQCDVARLVQILQQLDIEFCWLQRARSREQVVEFYRELDFQIIWRPQQRPLKNPLKIVNAMSFGIPTIAYPEVAYREVSGCYQPFCDLAELPAFVAMLRQGYDADRLVVKAEPYHIEHVAERYRSLP